MTLRLIIKSSFMPAGSNHVDVTYKTFDIEAPEVEMFLRGGGMNEDSFLLREFVGCEYFNQPLSSAVNLSDCGDPNCGCIVGLTCPHASFSPLHEEGR